jgi:uncharacterized protein YdiU (UPF0061 family)
MQAFRFDNAFVRDLPGDAEARSWPRQVHALYSRVQPTPVEAPRLVAYSREMASTLGVDPSFIESPAFARVFGGNALIDGMEPFAANYGGHQFGVWAGQLGDGRAITLGEVIDRTRAARMAAPFSDRRYASFFAAKRCITSASRRRER